MHPRPTSLIVATALAGRPKYKIAADAGLTGSAFSAILSGRAAPTDAQKRRIADSLGKPVDDLFPDQAA